jgi:6-phosphogluconate dehydrogenase
MKLGFLGLGKMGRRMANKLLSEMHEVTVWNRTAQTCEELAAERAEEISRGTCGLISIAGSLPELVEKLEKPRVVWVMLPAGEPTEVMVEALTGLLEKEDILIDGGNSHFKDTESRYHRLKEKGIRYLGIGVSGGIIAEKQGYPLMAGGDWSAYQYIEPVMASLAKPHGGYEYFGPGGAGHFVKMVHNGIEYGFMQSIGEGFNVLEKAPYDFDLLKVARLYQKGTLVSGFLMDRTVEVFERYPGLAGIDGVIAESGEGRWTVEQAKEEGVELEIIQRSLEYRLRSQSEEKVRQSFTARLIAALRNAFGGHEVQSLK